MSQKARSSEDLEKAVATAAEIAGKVPKELREAAFNRALDELLGSHAQTKRGTTAKESAQRGVDRRQSKRKSSGRLGPKAAVTGLIEDGYFDQPRTIADVQERLRSKKGLRFELGGLSPTLVRLLRDGELERERNDAGHYEYRVR